MASKRKSASRLGGENGTSIYDQVGGEETCRRLSERFHDRVANDPILRELFPKNLSQLAERFAIFIAEQLGGPVDYTAKRGKQSLVCRHAHLAIGSAEEEKWLEHMFAAMDEVGVAEPVRLYLRHYFTETAQTLADSFLPLYQLPLDELKTMLQVDPSLATTSDHGRTLLKNAAARWDLARVRLLLEYHADVNTKDLLAHDALYHAVNHFVPALEPEGCAVVELLIKHGANVNGQTGPGKSSPLHVAARRDSVGVAKVLLGAGAEIDMRDSKGETPLRRAVNCGQMGMVSLLLSHGADPLSRDKQGRTTVDAARQEVIRKALLEAVNRRTSP